MPSDILWAELYSQAVYSMFCIYAGQGCDRGGGNYTGKAKKYAKREMKLKANYSAENYEPLKGVSLDRRILGEPVNLFMNEKYRLELKGEFERGGWEALKERYRVIKEEDYRERLKLKLFKEVKNRYDSKNSRISKLRDKIELWIENQKEKGIPQEIWKEKPIFKQMFKTLDSIYTEIFEESKTVDLFQSERLKQELGPKIIEEQDKVLKFKRQKVPKWELDFLSKDFFKTYRGIKEVIKVTETGDQPHMTLNISTKDSPWIVLVYHKRNMRGEIRVDWA